jgi:hypothetical protein
LFKVKRIYLILPLYGRFWMLLKGAMVFANARASGCAEIWSQKELQE